MSDDDPRTELRRLRTRQAELELRVRLGRAPTAGTGLGGRLTRADIEAIAREPIEYQARRDEVMEAMAGYPSALPIDEAGRPLPITRAMVLSLTRPQIAANVEAIEEALRSPKETE